MTHGIVGYLVTAVAGYWVLERASTQKNRLKRVGQFVGWFVIASSVLGVLCYGWCAAGGTWGSCPFSKQTGDSHRFHRMMPPPAPGSGAGQ